MPAKKTKKSEKQETEEKVVSKKRVIYIEIDDEVTAVFDKIKNINAKHIYIVAPKRSIIFQSIVNLKILKRKSEDKDKKIYFITNDSNGIYLSQRVGIPVFDKPTEGKPSLFSADSGDDKLRITPISASINSVEEELPTRLKQKKLSISELLRKSRKGQKVVDVSKVSKSTRKKEKKEKSKLVLVAPNRHALIALTVVSVFILLVIIYIALPGATIYLTPTASVLEKSVNITLADSSKNRTELETRPPHMIASYPIEIEVTQSVTHYSTGKKFSERGANSSGKITVINTSSNLWPLVADTRFQTNDGIVFRITENVTVPAADSQGLGMLEVFVVADPEDDYGSIVGERGNIEPTTFFLPGLKDSSKSKLYAESYATMTGGVTDYSTYITAEDIEATKIRMNDELLNKAIDELEIAVTQKTVLTGGNISYSLLKGEGAIIYGEPTLNIPSTLEGQEVSEFTISGTLKVSGVYYDHDAMLEILVSELLLKKSPQKELLRVNEESTSYRIFEWDETKGKIRLTANIKGIEQFEINPDKENGARLLEKIKEHVVGKDVEEAKTYIQNLPEINKVEIDSWPVWSPNIPNIPDNIEFEIRDAIMVGE